MRAKVEAVKQAIEKTKKEIREKERKQEIIQKFEDLFGFPPDRVWWDEDLTLEAKSVINFKDFEEISPTIMERKVKEVSFWLVEEKLDLGYDIDWNFGKEENHYFIRYKWTRKLRKHVAGIEIVTERTSK